LRCALGVEGKTSIVGKLPVLVETYHPPSGRHR
jgi:hypothetical protein